MSFLLSLFVLGVLQWIILYRVITATTVEYKYVNESLFWQNAVTYCDIVLNGSLADGNIMSLPAVNESTSDLWIGRYSAYTHWTWITGCFRYSIVQDARVLSIRFNSVVNCHSNCNTTYVALVGTSCYCLPGRPDDINGSPSCNIACNGNKNELCGGNDAVSVYQKEISGSSNFATLPNEGNQPCGSITETDNSVLYFQRNCVEKFEYICKIYSSDENQFKTYPFPGYFSWDVSNNFCRTNNGSLWDIQSAAQYDGYLRESFDGDIWIGLYRLQNTFTIQERKPDDPKSMITCSYYDQGQIIEKTSQECQSEKKSFFCRIERKSDTSITSSPSIINSGAIAGIIIGILLIISVIFIAVIIFSRSKRKRNILGTPQLSEKPLNEDSTAQPIESTYAEANPVHGYGSESYSTVRKDDGIYNETEEGEYDVLHKSRERAQNDNHNEDYYDHTGKELYNHIGDTGNDKNYKHNHSAPEQISIQTENVYDHTVTSDRPNHVSTNKTQLNLNENLYSGTET